jgi:D-amino peptidase
VQVLSYLPIVEQVDSHTIRYIGNTIVDISKFIEFITSYNVAIEP